MSRKHKHSKSFKLKAVEDVLKRKLSLTLVSDTTGVNKCDIKKWVSYYMEYGLSGLEPRLVNQTYSGKFKSKVIKSIEEKGLSFRSAAIKFNIPSSSTVRNWYHIYQVKGLVGLYSESRGRTKLMRKKTSKTSLKGTLTREEELLEEIESLKAELALLKKLQALTPTKNKKL